MKLLFNKIVLLVLLLALPILNFAQCPNGGLESNNFNNWETYAGRNYNGPVDVSSMGGQGSWNPPVQIVPAGNDPAVGAGLQTVYRGNYALRVGNNNYGSAGQMTQAARYKVQVTASNAHVSFAYALVFLEPGGHLRVNSPYFSFWVSKSDNIRASRTNGNLITETTIVDDPTDPRLVPTGSIYLYKPWASVCLDLSSYIGQEVYIYFATAGCNYQFGPHWSYAYIDGLCDPNLLTPVADFTLPSPSITCASDLIADGSNSTDEVDHYWQVTALGSNNAGDVLPGTDKVRYFYNSTAGIQNLYDMYVGLGGKFYTGYYLITLGVRGCGGGTWTTKQVIVYLETPPLVILNPDIYRCCGSSDPIKFNAITTPIVSTIPPFYASMATFKWYDANFNFLGNGTYSWTPFFGSYAYTNSFTPPTTDNGIYIVKYTDDKGCSNSAQVRVINKPKTFIPYIVSNYCAISCKLPTTLTANVLYPKALTFPSNPVPCSNNNTAINNQLTPLANSESFLTYQWSTGETSKTINIHPGITNYSVTVSNGCASFTANFNISNQAIFNGNFLPQGTSSGNLNNTNAFVLSNHGRMVFFEVGIPQNQAPAYRATKYKLEVFNRWGQVVWEESKEAPCSGFPNWSISWDGRTSLNTPSGFVDGYTVYNWQLIIYNCKGYDNPSKGITYSGNVTVF